MLIKWIARLRHGHRFHHPVALFLASVLALFAAFAIAADTDSQTSGSARVLLRFLDSRTGAAVVPMGIDVNGQAVSEKAGKSGTLALTLPNGRHDIVVNAENYETLTATVLVDGPETPVNEFELDPISTGEPPKELPPSDVAVLEGFTTDADSGELLPGVVVEVTGGNPPSVSDGAGKFELAIPLPGQEAAGTEPGLEKPRITLNISKTGYRPEERRNVEVMPGDRRSYQIRLERTTDETTSEPLVTDEAAPNWSARDYDWVYDMTLL